MYQGSASSLSATYGHFKVETTADSGIKGKLKSVTKESEEAKDQEINSINAQPKELRYFDPKVKIG